MGSCQIRGGFYVNFVSNFNIVHCGVVRHQLVRQKAQRSEGEAENYALAGRKLSTPLIAVTIIGLAVGGASTIGVSEHAFRVGLSAGWYTIAWALGAIVMGLFMAKKYREQNITTISELIERHMAKKYREQNITTISELIERHHDMKAVVLGVFCQIVIQLVIISLQYIAGGSILHAIMPDVFDFQTGMVVSAIVFIGITFIGGMWSASLSNVLNIVLIYVGILIATVVQFYRVGGMEGLAACHRGAVLPRRRDGRAGCVAACGRAVVQLYRRRRHDDDYQLGGNACYG